MTEARLELHPGPCATEAALLEEVGRLAAASRECPELLREPIRIVVPSRSLREHVAARLVAEHGAVAGVVVQTLRGVACEIVRRAGEATPGGDSLFPVLVRRCAAADPALREALEELHDGYGVVAATVGDLLDAGLEEAHAEGIEEWLAEVVGGVLARRGRGLVRVALSVARELAAHELEHRSGVLQRAAALLGDAPELLPARAMLVHGVADVTGRAAELLEALVRRQVLVLVDHPPDPADPASRDSGVVFTDRLLTRLALPSVRASVRADPPRLGAFRAPGAEAEVREVAERCASLIEQGVRPEAIGIVARDLSEYAAPVRVQLTRVGVPFSGAPGAAVVRGPEAHAGDAVLALLREGGALPADRWLDATDWLAPLYERDLRLGLHALGLARLGDVASLDVAAVLGPADVYRLPVRRGLRREESEDPSSTDDGEGSSDERGAPARSRLRAVSRMLSRKLLETAQARAAGAAHRLASWPAEATLEHHLRELAGLLADDLGWNSRPGGAERGRAPRGVAEQGRSAWHQKARELLDEVGSGVRLAREELVLLLERATRDVGLKPLGGSGGGVAVLSVVEARARTFEHLFVIGLGRDRFPRPIVDDPLLPDAVRIRLCELLPDLPVKNRGFEEERYLFAQLCSAAPDVTLSWQEVSDDGKDRAPSPLVQRLLLAGSGLAGKDSLVAEVLGERPGAAVPELERAIRRALAGDSGGLGEERARVVSELDPPYEQRARLGPYFGSTGSLPDLGDLHVTRLEAMARCGWQAFLERVLRVEPLPDARIALPSLDPRLLGSVVHAVLEKVATAAGVPANGVLDASAPAFDVPWPGEEVLGGLLQQASLEAIREEGITQPGFATVLSRRARPFLERARSIDWASGVLRGVVGVEVEGSARVAGDAGEELRVLFRADRVDRVASGSRLTDYKTGRPVYGEAKTPGKRLEKLLDALGDGTWLQAAAYARADLQEGAASGRYLFAKDLDVAPFEIEVTGEDTEVGVRFERAVRTLLAQLAEGCFVPRLVEPDGSVPRRCTEWCAVSDACLQHDTGSRHRLLAWASGTSSGSPAEEVARRGWQLGAKENA
jgi:hypothetical protein